MKTDDKNWNLMKRILFVLVFTSIASLFAEDAAVFKVWNPNLPTGQWRFFGEPIQSKKLISGDVQSMSIDVLWDRATFGVGAAFDQENEKEKESAMTLPSLTGYKKIRFEAMLKVDDGTVATVEFGYGAKGKGHSYYRAGKGLEKPIESRWTLVEFLIPDDFPTFKGGEAIDAIQIIFINKEKSGKNQINLRNVELVP
ncbi:MAG: hypothetical protein V4507_04065 [Verrucomicrobiota bacterium]